MIALSGIALSFSRESYVEVAAARNAQSLEDSYFVARAGIATTVYQLMAKQITPSVTRAQLKETPDPVDLGLVTGNFGGGAYRVNVQDESGKINLNTVSAEQLLALADAAGIPKQDADIIADSILDWRDSDKLFRLNGAEDDYYRTLNPPYKAKNGRFDTVEELLLVKGITPTYFYGYPERTVGRICRSQIRPLPLFHYLLEQDPDQRQLRSSCCSPVGSGDAGSGGSDDLRTAPYQTVQEHVGDHP